MITPEFGSASALESESAQIAYLIQFNFTTGVERITTAPHDVTYGGNPWSGQAGVIELGRWSRSSDTLLTPMSIILTVGPEYTNRVSDILTACRNRLCRIWLVVLDEGAVTMAAHIITRRMVPGAVRGGSTYTIEIVLESRMNQSRVRAGRRVSHAEQQLRDSSDYAFVNAGNLPRARVHRNVPRHA